MAKRSNFTKPFYISDDYDIQLTLTEIDANGVETALDLTGGTVEFSFGVDNATAELLKLSSTVGAEITIESPPTAGIVTLHLRQAQTVLFSSGPLYHEGQFIDSGALEETVVIGSSLWYPAVLN